MQEEVIRQITTREEAKAQGLKFYWEGEACPQGHLAPRYLSGNRCVECSREYHQKYNQTDRRKGSLKKAQHMYQKSEKGEQAAARKNANSPSFRRKYPAALVPLTPQEQEQIKAIYTLALKARKLTGLEYDVDHCYPLAMGGIHHPLNLQILPAWVNRQKARKIDHESPMQNRGRVVSMIYRAVAAGYTWAGN